MDPFAALLAGLLAGLAIAMQFGAVSVLLVEASVASGPRVGLAAGMAVATADLGFAAVAAAGGAAAGAALASREAEIHVIAAVVLAGIAVHGLVRVVRERATAGRALLARSPADAAGAPAAAASPRAQYARFLAMTAANPLTIVSFATVAAALSLAGPAAAVAFAAGVGAASAGWHCALTLAAGHAGRWVTPRIRLGLAVGGRVAVLAIAAHLVLGI